MCLMKEADCFQVLKIIAAVLDFKDVQSELVLNRTFNLVSLCYALNEPNEVWFTLAASKDPF